MNDITELFGIGVWIMTFRTPLEKAIEDQLTALDKAAGPLSKLAGITDNLRKLAQTGGLEKSVNVNDYLAKSDAIMDEALAQLQRVGDAMQEAIATAERASKALPAFRRWALHGIPDPDAISQPLPPRDPLEPIRNYGTFSVAEKRVTIDDHGRRSAPTFSPLPMPQQPQPQVDPEKNVGAVAMLRNTSRGED